MRLFRARKASARREDGVRGAGGAAAALCSGCRSIAWDGLVGCRRERCRILGIQLWAAGDRPAVQGVVGFLAYEVSTGCRPADGGAAGDLVVFAIKLVGGHQIVTPPAVHGATSRAPWLEVTIALRLSVCGRVYASDFSRYCPQTSTAGVVG